MPQVRPAAKPTTLGHYTLIERIGTGGQGEVWKAHDDSRGVDIALKVFPPAAARNPAAWGALEREYEIASRLQHPGILQVLAPERVEDVLVLPMELASGGDLRRLRGAGYLEIVPVLLEVAEALEYAHARGVVHRDLKPGNVLFDSRGRVKVADFGIAALLPAAGGGAAEQHGGGHSPFSASPEQLRGEPPSAADDIYGLGALAYELLSGHPPYYPNFELRRVLTQPVPELEPTRQIPPELGEIVMRMLAKSAAERPGTMQQVMDELDTTLNATLSFAPEGAEEGAAEDLRSDTIQPSGREASESRTAVAPAAPAAPQAKAAARSEVSAPAAKVGPGEKTEKSHLPHAAVGRTPASSDSGRRPGEPPPAQSPERRPITPEAAAATAKAAPNSATDVPPSQSGHSALSRLVHAFKQGVSGGVPQDAARAASHEAEQVPPEEAARVSRHRTERAGSHESKQAPSRETAHVGPHETAHAAPRDAAQARSRDAVPHGTIHAASREPVQAAPRETAHAASQGAAHTAPHEAEQAALRETTHAAPQGGAYATWHEAAHGAPHRDTHVASQAGADDVYGWHRAEQPAHVFATSAETVSRDDPFDWETAHPRLRATPLSGRPHVPARTGTRRSSRWPYLLSGLLCGAALICAATAAALFWLPRQDIAGLQSLLASIASGALPKPTAPSASAPAKPAVSPAPAAAPEPQADPAALGRLNTERADFERRAAALEARGAAAWDAADFSAAQMQAAEANGAAAAGGVPIALQHMNQAEQLLANVAQRAPQALAAELKAGDAALAAGHQELANQAYALARRINPNSQRAIDGARRARMLTGVLPLLSDAQRAESARNYSRAAQDFSQALSLDPGNAAAKDGLARANAAFGDDNYARSVGAGFAALGAGRLDAAQTDFQQALDFRPQGTEATEGLQRVSAAMKASRIAALRQQAATLEADEHWRQAVAVYDTALHEDPSLAFARRGKSQDEARAELSESLQQIIDHPDRLAFPAVRDEAVNLLQEAREQSPAGPVLQSQTERLAELLPQLNRPVLLNMISDNATQVTIPSIGVFGTFGRREIRLKPGTYTVIGTRDGYRAVHQEFTVEPGQQTVTITVTCSEPI